MTTKKSFREIVLAILYIVLYLLLTTGYAVLAFKGYREFVILKFPIAMWFTTIFITYISFGAARYILKILFQREEYETRFRLLATKLIIVSEAFVNMVCGLAVIVSLTLALLALTGVFST